MFAYQSSTYKSPRRCAPGDGVLVQTFLEGGHMLRATYQAGQLRKPYPSDGTGSLHQFIQQG